ncbi:hypothetical protein P0L94_01775 [Microbacter sp. GSS18]|nr:hypothetical protein P0L94_01775 [Microbacter sp. GSS18]
MSESTADASGTDRPTSFVVAVIVTQRVGAWRLIVATTILTTASWVGYCAFAVVFIAGPS